MERTGEGAEEPHHAREPAVGQLQRVKQARCPPGGYPGARREGEERRGSETRQLNGRWHQHTNAHKRDVRNAGEWTAQATKGRGYNGIDGGFRLALEAAYSAHGSQRK